MLVDETDLLVANKLKSMKKCQAPSVIRQGYGRHVATQDSLETLLTVSNRRPKSSNKLNTQTTEITIDEAAELISKDPAIFLQPSLTQNHFAPVVKGQQVQPKIVKYRLVFRTPEVPIPTPP